MVRDNTVNSSSVLRPKRLNNKKNWISPVGFTREKPADRFTQRIEQGRDWMDLIKENIFQSSYIELSHQFLVACI